MPVVNIAVEQNAAKSGYSNKFVITSEFMHGDDDFDATRISVFPGDRKDLVIEFLNYLDNTAAALDDNEYMDSVPGYEKFGDSYSDQFEYGLERGWPIDCDTSIEASYCGSTLEFYDHSGTRYNVIVESTE